MVLDGVRAYLQLATGLTDVTRERALVAAKSLVAQGEASVGAALPDSVKSQVGSLADDLVAASKANRALLIGLVSTEVEHATARLGLAFASQLEAEQRRAKKLEARVAELERELGDARAASTTAKKTTARKKAAKKSTTKKSTTKKTAATPTTPPPSTEQTTTTTPTT